MVDFCRPGHISCGKVMYVTCIIAQVGIYSWALISIKVFIVTVLSHYMNYIVVAYNSQIMFHQLFMNKFVI